MSAKDHIDEGLARGLSLEELRDALEARLGLDTVATSRIREPGSSTMVDPPLAGDLAPDTAIAELDRYEDLGLLGAGGMGEVRRVRDHKLDRTLAMKLIHPECLGSASIARRFLAEARATAQLQHPGIVPVHDMGRMPDGRLWFTMKEVDGVTLARMIRTVHNASPKAWMTTRSGWSLRRLVETIVQVCDAVAYAHSRGVMHRDLKPANVMLGDHGEVLVLDWGLVKFVDIDETTDRVALGSTQRLGHQTVVGTVTGTPAYMSPEQAAGRIEDMDQRSDVYALGAILYCVLKGSRPYPDIDSADALRKVLAGPPAPLDADHTGPPPPPALVATCERAMARNPDDRFPDAEAVARALRAWLDGAQRRQDALAVIARASRCGPDADFLRTHARTLRAEAAALLEGVHPWQPEADKLPGWELEDRAAALDKKAAHLDLEEQLLLNASLSHAPDLPEAHAALANRYRREHATAEAARQDTDRAETLFRQHLDALPTDHPEREGHLTYLKGDGALTLVTDPPGAEVLLYRYTLHNRRLVPRLERNLGTTPLRAVPLPMGSYLCLIRHPDRPEVRYPVAIRRGEHWDGVPPEGGDPHPIPIPTQEELGPRDHYVPAGWFQQGGDPSPESLIPARRVWVDGRIFRRFQVTNREYLTFLHSLIDSGRTIEALRHAPRERGGTPDEPGALVLSFDGERFGLRRDADGHVWTPDMPVSHVAWTGAEAFAAWEARSTGQPWRLPGELAWEKAARGVDGRVHPWGNGFDASWAATRYSREDGPMRCETGMFPVDESVYGIRDLAGSATEWCADEWRKEGPPLMSARGSGPFITHEATNRAARGGSWFYSSARHMRATSRANIGYTDRHYDIGFRLARSYE